jgi:hypothetical protein
MVQEKRTTRANTVTTAFRTVPSRSAMRKRASEPWQHNLATLVGTPQSPVFVGPGVNASSVPHVVEVVSFVSAPTPQHTTPKDPRPANPSQSPHRLHHMPSHNPRLAPTPPVLSPLLLRSTNTWPQITRPHMLSSLTGTHTPRPVAPASPARRLVLCHGLLLWRPYHDNHAALTWHRQGR